MESLRDGSRVQWLRNPLTFIPPFGRAFGKACDGLSIRWELAQAGLTVSAQCLAKERDTGRKTTSKSNHSMSANSLYNKHLRALTGHLGLEFC